MLRFLHSRPAIVVGLALLWSAAMISIALVKETPVGNVRGVVIGTDTGKPIKGASVSLYQREAGHYDGYYLDAQSDSQGRFHFDNVPIGRYTIEASAQVHSMPKSEVLVREGHIEALDLKLVPGPPSLDLYINRNVYTSKDTPKLNIHGFSKDSQVAISIYRLDSTKLLSSEGDFIRGMLMSSDSVIDTTILNNNPVVESSETRMIDVIKRDCEGVYQQSVKLDGLATGVYLIAAAVDGITKSGWISKSDLSIVTKVTNESTLVYAARPDTGDAVSDAECKVFQSGDTVADGLTDSSGLWITKFSPATGARPNRTVFARLGSSVAFLNPQSYESVSDAMTIYAYTERPVYRPGQSVLFKGIARTMVGDSYRLPAKGEARVEVRDPRGTLVYSGNSRLTEFGSFSGSMKLPDYAPTGQYDVSSTVEGYSQSTEFSVSAYKKPEFAVTVIPARKRYTRGETVKANISANYYFGAPLVGAKIRYSVTRSEYWMWPSDEEEYGDDGSDGDYEDSGGYGDNVADGEVQTGSDGTAEITFKANWKTSRDAYSSPDQRFAIYAYVTDASGQESSGEASVIATQGDYQIGFEPERYVNQLGETARVRLSVQDYDGRPQRAVDLVVTAYRTTWDDNGEKNSVVSKAKLTTDDMGYAWFSYKPTKPGSYTLRAVSRDKHAHIIKASDWAWVSGEGDDGGYQYPDLKITLDKKNYDPGDTARVLINSKETGTTALITVEGRRLYYYKTVTLSKKSTLVEIPVDSSYKPNFFVSVCYVKNAKLITQEARAKVSLKAQSIKLTITPDKKKYEPGATAKYLVKATDAAGKPVEAEVSLGVVDESIYAIRPDDTPDIRKYFYAQRHNSVQTHFSCPEVYLSADKGGFTGKVRKEFLDTAFWRADVVTNEMGEARVTFKMPDNLTTWRATARACTKDTALGECRSTVITTKKLLVRLETPRFLIQRDRCVITALVHNYLPKRQKVNITLRAAGLDIDGRRSKQIVVDSQGMGSVKWTVNAEKLGNATLTAYAVAPSAQDAMELTLPIKPHGNRRVDSVAGSLSNGAVEKKMMVREDSVSGASEIRIRLAPSMAATMLGSLGYLTSYPYGCTEQTMSAFLPDVVIWRTLDSLGIRNEGLQKRLPDMVAKGLNRLYESQNGNGGWGWCQYSSPDDWMTSYVVYGLLVAKSAGFAVNEYNLSSGLSAIHEQMKNKFKPGGSINNRLFALYTLTLAGESDYAWQLLRPLLQYKMDSQGLALAAMIAQNSGHSSNAKALIDVLWKRATTIGNDTYWKTYDRWYDSPSETTALALMAVVKITPDDSRIPSIIGHLLGERYYDHWYSTRDTAMVLYALSEYMKHTKELQPNYSVDVTCNGATVANVKFDMNSVFSPEREIVIKSKNIKAGSNKIKLEIHGQGRLYYTMQLVQYVKSQAQGTANNDSGLSITRQYRKLRMHWDSSTGESKYESTGPVYSDFRIGDIVQVRLIIRNKSKRAYSRLLIEDYLPAGCESYDRGRLEPWEWVFWYSDKDVRDERVSFYVDDLPKGQSVLEYQMRASTAGSFVALPSLIDGMYQPALGAVGNETKVTVRD